MNSAEFSTACRLRLGIESEDSVLCQKTGGGLITRHNIIRDVIEFECRQAALSPTIEKQYLLENSAAKPADIYIPSSFLLSNHLML